MDIQTSLILARFAVVWIFSNFHHMVAIQRSRI